MPPRYAYWTIIYGNQATAFRAAVPEDLLPTLRQLQRAHPDAVLKFFARGRLWNSEEEARAALVRRPHDRRGRPARPEGRAEGSPRGRNWRPGGEHRDPRERFKVPRDVKRRRFAARLRRKAAPREGDAPRTPKSAHGPRSPGRAPRPPKKKDDE
jgi:hypothetical protein